MHQVQFEPATTGCLLEFTWASGGVTLLEDGSDLTLAVSSVPWTDPYGGCTAAQRDQLAVEVGLWTRQQVADGDPLARVVGEKANNVEPLLNQVSQLGGIQVEFETVGLTVVVLTDGLLAVEVADL